MTNEFQPRPLPDADDYANAAHAVQQAMDKRGLDAKLYLPSFSFATESIKEFSKDAAKLAKSLEPINSETGVFVDTQRRRGRALFLGAMAGYSILREIYGVSLPSGSMLQHIPSFLVDYDETKADGLTESIYDSAVRVGLSGSETYGEDANKKIGQWSEEAVSHSFYRPTFIAASGLIALAGVDMQNQRIEQFHIDLLHEHVENNEVFDWDVGLANLNSQE